MILGTVPYYSVYAVKKTTGRTWIQISSNSSFIVTLLCLYIYIFCLIQVFSLQSSSFPHVSWNHRMVWVGRELEAPLILILLPWAVTPPIRSGCPKPHPVGHWALPTLYIYMCTHTHVFIYIQTGKSYSVRQVVVCFFILIVCIQS